MAGSEFRSSDVMSSLDRLEGPTNRLIFFDVPRVSRFTAQHSTAGDIFRMGLRSKLLDARVGKDYRSAPVFQRPSREPSGVPPASSVFRLQDLVG